MFSMRDLAAGESRLDNPVLRRYARGRACTAEKDGGKGFVCFWNRRCRLEEELKDSLLGTRCWEDTTELGGSSEQARCLGSVAAD